MFDNIPTEADPSYLSGIAQFIASSGEKANGVEKNELAWAANQVVGLARVPNEGDGRAKQSVVSADEAGDDALPADEYTANIFNEEMSTWTRSLLGSVDSED